MEFLEKKFLTYNEKNSGLKSSRASARISLKNDGIALYKGLILEEILGGNKFQKN